MFWMFCFQWREPAAASQPVSTLRVDDLFGSTRPAVIASPTLIRVARSEQ
jgi:hypothetical protein